MFNLNKFISENVTFRKESMFFRDIVQNSGQLSA